jgi:transposase InsO family protein
MRVDGRLKNASLTFVSKHQAILPPFHPFTTALIRAYHQENAHAGPNLTLATLQREFWIVNGKNAVRKVTRSCVPCFRVSPKTANQLMGDLPSYRVNQDHISPFLKVGVDYAGPVYIKQRNKRSTVEHKGYICLFVCTAVKAVHLELVGDLTTASFLAALDRFIARRGKPELIISDNGTNFVGAKSELDDLHNLFVNDAHRNAIQGFCATKSIEWKFIPPRSPNFGGLWESAVKSVKFHLKRIIGPTKHDYEELYTILCQIEGILNSRPITPATNDPRDLEPLTPGHFLIFRPMNAVPRTDFTERKETTLDRWTRTTKIVQHFWDRWHLEYLNTLQGRYKWHTDVQVSLGQMVVIKEDNIPPQHWSLGRIVTLVHGADGLVRVVDVLTKSGILRRPLRRLCFLPIMDNNVKAEETTFHRPGE